METIENSKIVGNRYLRFSLGNEEYAIPLLKVKEVIAPPEVTPIPQTPNYYVGIMNLRGQVITLLDLRTRLNIKPVDSSEKAVIICDMGSASIGVVVDSINSVISPRSEDLSEKPELKNQATSDYIEQVFKAEKGLVLLLDIDQLLGKEINKIQARKAG